jgi:hypothetical protein
MTTDAIPTTGALSGALCVGRPWLFESMEAADHLEARAICAQCPAILACRVELQRVSDLAATVTAQGGGPVGTWAGVLVGRSGANARGRIRAACGTDSGYFRHRRSGEAPCRDCTRAHRVAGRRRSL